MQFEVKNAPLPVLICKLEAGESVECQKGAMSWMTASMKMETNLGSGGAGLLGALGKMAKSAVTGESIFRNKYSASCHGSFFLSSIIAAISLHKPPMNSGAMISRPVRNSTSRNLQLDSTFITVMIDRRSSDRMKYSLSIVFTSFLF